MSSEGEPRFSPAPGLEGIHFLQGLHVNGYANAYFVERNAGNVLVSPFLYGPGLADWMQDRGGLDLIFVTHHDEIRRAALSGVGRSKRGPPPDRIPACQYKERLGARIALHELDTDHLTECAVDLRWTEDFHPSEDLQFIHTPGHTPGSACLLLRHGGRRILFCGDTGELDASLAIPVADVTDDEIEWVRPAFEKLLRFRFDSLVPLHTEAASPQPFLLSGGRAALWKAYSELGNRQA